MNITRRRFLAGAGALTASTLLSGRVVRAQASPVNPLMITEMRKRSYPGSAFVVERTLPQAASYTRAVASYLSDGLKIYAYLTIPRGKRPASGWPVVIFNHGFIPPATYRTTERYIAYQDAFARNGYIVIRSDYRGHDRSEGDATGGYGTPAYTVDVLNALGSAKRVPEADPARIGMWGHSMGGHITLRSMTVTKDIKAGVIWAGVVSSYEDMLLNWHRPNSALPPPGTDTDPTRGRRWRTELVETYGPPSANPAFWESISPISYVGDVAPISIHHGTKDESVPIEMSEALAAKLKGAGRIYEFFKYEGADHNISRGLTLALKRSVSFFDKYVKAG